MQRRISILLLILLGALTFGLGVQADEGELNVVATHSILADVVTNVSGDQLNIATLMPAGADPHTFIPSPSDLTMIAKADLVIINGAGFEESLLTAIEGAGEAVNIIAASACIEVRPLGAAMHDDDEHADDHDEDDDHADDHDDDDDHADDHDDDDDHADDHDDDDDHADDHDDDDDHADDHDDDEGHADDHDDMDGVPDCDDHDDEFNALVGEEEDGHAHFETLGREQDIDCGGAHGHDDTGHGHGEGNCDPHVWMDPHNVIYWVLVIRDALSAADPDNAESYAANAEVYAQDLVALEAEFILPALEALPAENRVLVTSHESLGYFATTFGFEILTTVVPGMSTAVEPSARDIAALIDRVSAEGVPAMFGDTQTPEDILMTIANAVGIDLIGIYSDTLSASDGPASTYLDYMRYNVSTIVAALQA